MSFRDLQERWKAFASTDRGKRLIKIGRGVFLALVVGVLMFQASEIGWKRILASLPTQPAFYVLVLAMYFVLPITESMIYGRLWSLPAVECVGVMIRKRVLNVDIVGYSGEVYLLLWARERVAASSRQITGTIKDNLIVSAGASLIAAGVLIGGLLTAGQLPLGKFVDAPSFLYLALGALTVLFLTVVAYRFRHVIFSLSRGTLTLLASAHVGRFLI